MGRRRVRDCTQWETRKGQRGSTAEGRALTQVSSTRHHRHDQRGGPQRLSGENLWWPWYPCQQCWYCVPGKRRSPVNMMTPWLFRINGSFVRRNHRCFPHRGSVVRNFEVVLIASMKRLLNKHSNGRWFETSNVLMWRPSDAGMNKLWNKRSNGDVQCVHGASLRWIIIRCALAETKDTLQAGICSICLGFSREAQTHLSRSRWKWRWRPTTGLHHTSVLHSSLSCVLTPGTRANSHLKRLRPKQKCSTFLEAAFSSTFLLLISYKKNCCIWILTFLNCQGLLCFLLTGINFSPSMDK